MKELNKYTKKELIEFIRLYNDLVRIKNYHKMKKSDLIKIINEKFTLNEKGEITVNNLKTSTKKSLKVIKQQKKKIEDLSERELYKLLGSLRGDKDKLLDDIKELKEDIEIEQNKDDEADEKLILKMKKEIENREPKIIQLKQEINKTIDLIMKVKERDEPKEKEQNKKDEFKKSLLSAMTKKANPEKEEKEDKDFIEFEKKIKKYNPKIKPKLLLKAFESYKRLQNMDVRIGFIYNWVTKYKLLSKESKDYNKFKEIQKTFNLYDNKQVANDASAKKFYKHFNLRYTFDDDKKSFLEKDKEDIEKKNKEDLFVKNQIKQIDAQIEKIKKTPLKEIEKIQKQILKLEQEQANINFPPYPQKESLTLKEAKKKYNISNKQELDELLNLLLNKKRDEYIKINKDIIDKYNKIDADIEELQKKLRKLKD